MYKKLISLAIFLTLGALYAVNLYNDGVGQPENGTHLNFSFVTEIPAGRYSVSGKVRLSDGDSLKFESDAKRARFFAIDSPELAQTCMRDGKEWKCGLQAKRALKKLINGQSITCIGDEKDKYDRLIATCYLRSQKADANGYINLNAWMVENGWATAYTYYSERYIRQEKYAKKQNLGIWNGTFMEPFKWRQQNGRN